VIQVITERGIHMNETETALPNLIRKLRGRESLRNASTRIGISHNYLNNLEKGIDPRTGKVIHPSPEILEKIGKAYSYSYDELMKLAGYTKDNTSIATINLKEIIFHHPELYWGEQKIDDLNRKRIQSIITTLLIE
jgi:transcriptional regulator with XRE-family HTH domain